MRIPSAWGSHIARKASAILSSPKIAFDKANGESPIHMAGAGDRQRRRLGQVKTADHSSENMTTLRRLGLNPMKGEKALKIGVAAKRKRAGWNLERLRTILRLAQ